MTGHRVARVPRDRPHPAPLPRDIWIGREFIEADGTVAEVVWDGTSRVPPSDCGRQSSDWPTRSWHTVHRIVGRRHLSS